MAEDEKKGTSSYRLYCSIKCFQKPSSPEQKHGNLAETEQKKPGGWRAMPFILGNGDCDFDGMGALSPP
ncbi:hypothetical protein NC652_024815 [Populus alba x Populus x berolinensis]|nr:hypothetical protein NC652_024815 [Populus alba x Populus x berolinensis]